MRTSRFFATFILVLAVLLPARAAAALDRQGFELSVVVDGADRTEYAHDGTWYVEALRGRDYALRITNPTPYRVAVALSVDGLNTIDARHTDARNAAKWVLGPYESTVISGWQVSGSSARRFFFTGERHSYGAALGDTENLGVIEAVFFREREHYAEKNEAIAPAPPRAAERGAAAGKAAPQSAEAAPQTGLSDDYAATGMGERDRHETYRVAVDLDPHPAARLRIRYEFRPQLVALGVLPSGEEPLDRREHARGFAGYCPEPRY